MPIHTHRPNILFLICDQFRHDYMGCAGHPTIHTPNIDRIAENGIRFTHCYTNAPVCSPARIGLASGQRPFRIGSLDNASYLPLSVKTYHHQLRDYGYRTACIGKLDLAKPDNYNGRHGDRPSVFAYGFTHPIEAEGKMHAGNTPEPLGPYGFWLQEKGLFQKFSADYMDRRTNWVGKNHDSVLPTEAFEDIWIGDRAAQWITDAPDDFPWFYFVSFVGPHDPFDPPKEFADKYRNREMPNPIPPALDGKPAYVRNKAKRWEKETEDALTSQRQYSAAIEAIDAGIGKILQALEARGQLDNTYIIFSADHGEMLGNLGLFQKSVPYEGAARVPLIVSGPGIETGRTSDALVELIDLNPTVCEMADIPVLPELDAKSIMPVVADATQDHREYVHMQLRHFRAIRNRQFKYIETYNDGIELYDLESDPGETTNIAGEHPDICRSMRSQLVVEQESGSLNR